MFKINRLNLIKSTQSARLLFQNNKSVSAFSNTDDVDELSDSFLDNYRSTDNYKSKYSLNNIYPDSSLDFTKHVEVSVCVMIY